MNSRHHQAQQLAYRGCPMFCLRCSLATGQEAMGNPMQARVDKRHYRTSTVCRLIVRERSPICPRTVASGRGGSRFGPDPVINDRGVLHSEEEHSMEVFRESLERWMAMHSDKHQCCNEQFACNAGARARFLSLSSYSSCWQ